MASRELVLNCLVFGGDPERAVFEISIANTQNVAGLIRAIKAHNAHIKAKELSLWKVSIPYDSTFTTTVNEYTFENNSVRTMQLLSSVFDEPLDHQHLHVLVRGELHLIFFVS